MRDCKHGRSCPSQAVLFRHLQRKIVLTEPLRISYFLTAGITSGKISLVQITISFFGLGDFLYDTFGSTIVGICFSARFHTFSGPLARKFALWPYRLNPSCPLPKGHMPEVIIIEKDNLLNINSCSYRTFPNVRWSLHPQMWLRHNSHIIRKSIFKLYILQLCRFFT